MGQLGIAGVILTPLKRIQHPKGDVFHAMKKNDPGFTGFGEAYFSTVNPGDIKGWKRHLRMTLNLVVPVGEIRFVMHDGRGESSTSGKFFESILSPSNYHRLTIPPGIWLGFQGLGSGLNLLLNLADIEHEPSEGENAPLDTFPFQW